MILDMKFRNKSK